MTAVGHTKATYGSPLEEWEKALVLPPPINAPHVPCPKCGARQWVRERFGYTCLTCGKEVLTASDGVLLRNFPYHSRERIGVPKVYTANYEHPKRRGMNSAVGDGW